MQSSGYLPILFSLKEKYNLQSLIINLAITIPKEGNIEEKIIIKRALKDLSTLLHTIY